MNAEIKRGSLEMIAAMLISGSIGWFVLMSGQPVINVVFWRCAIGALVLLAVCAALGQLRPGILTRATLLLAIAGGVALVLNWLLLFAAYSYASISIATAVYNTQPFMLVGLGALFLGEKLTARKLLWLALAFAGVLMVVLAQPRQAGGQHNYLVGIGLSLGAAFFYALMALAAKRLKGTPPHLIALIQVTVGTVMLLPLVNFHAPTSTGQWGMLVTVGVLHTGLMYVLMYGALQKLPTNLIGSLSFIYPIAAMLVDRLAFGHRLVALQLAGAAIILLAAAGMNLLGERRLAPTPGGKQAPEQ
ncbi:DMT family transporter [Serratia entomophila]|uniref:DMT family transporter n=1 Tax=Serratia entomophila TaxID=42906 RepID=UPI002177D075|nr:DMT family transporter [Serratia entomophila]CAI0789425.1 Probable amino-acid metabolite efflux pump [Serratia entomophila]CAI1572164.1 Probable amino-acid metabolite efflux pump [Serratia entomophila]CAI1581417.1 Probable amino-acid metabolite efflux pump [Serratia entomophila]CAI1603194.1 Probable amino-acid metabolite efflux pump [Serratia entomophila]CAI1695764.1 Probable amino-acid metabolite efflux pump [Serratia entomophila]